MAPLLKKYRELEQIRFVEQMAARFSPDLLDDYVEAVNAIFDIRATPLLYVMSQYYKVAKKEQEQKVKESEASPNSQYRAILSAQKSKILQDFVKKNPHERVIF